MIATLLLLAAQPVTASEEPDTGWNELLELHRALKGLSGIKDVPAPTPEPPSWRATQRGWAQAF